MPDDPIEWFLVMGFLLSLGLIAACLVLGAETVIGRMIQ